MRERLPDREPWDYSDKARSNDEWPDHRLRVLASAAMLAWMAPSIVMDPACGDASIVRTAHALRPIEMAMFADLSNPNVEKIQQMIGRRELPDHWGANCVSAEFLIAQPWTRDVIVLTEILEHLEDPDALLRLAGERCRRLLVSSPEMRPGQVDTNPEHLWMFDGEGYETMLNDAGWKGVQKTHLTFRSEYDFQIWVAEKL